MKPVACLFTALLLVIPSSAQQPQSFSEPHRFIAAHGRRAWIGGYADRGMEAWAGPLQIADGIRPEFRRSHDVQPIQGVKILSGISADPTHVVRTYIGPDFVVNEEMWVPLEEKVIVVRYRVRSLDPPSITVRFHPSLNLMWPAALGGQDVHWDGKHSAYIMTDAARQFAAVVMAPNAASHDEPLNYTAYDPAQDELAISLGPNSPAVLFAEVDPKPEPAGTWDAVISPLEKILATNFTVGNEQHAIKVRSDSLEIETPDSSLNNALAWAEVALDQDWFCNDKLGCGFVGGYGPSRRGRRPQYAWYFAGDGLVSMHAALAIGNLDRAREELRFIAKYQDQQSGMIWHELSQSAPYLDWRGKYPYMFVHADVTYPYISAVADYLRASGDREFLKEIWPSVQKAFVFGRSLLGAGGLPEVPEGKEGADEQTPLREELGLTASWITACKDYSYLAESMGDAAAAADTATLAAKSRSAFAARYWDPGSNFAIQGFHRDGSPVVDKGLGAVGAVATGLFTDAQSAKVLDQIASWRFQSDWGTRSVAVGEPGYNPTIYAHGSVWAISTADVAQAYWMEHRPETAWQIWRNLIPWFTLDSPGHMHEVLAGDTYHPQFESVPEQSWSTASFLNAAIHGLLGVDVAENALTFSPHLPGSWEYVNIRHLRVGRSLLSIQLHKSQNGMTLRLVNSGAKVPVTFDPEIPLGAVVDSAGINGSRIAVRARDHAQDRHVSLRFEAAGGETVVEIHYRNGIEIEVPQQSLAVGDSSRALKLKSISLQGNRLSFDADMIPSERNYLVLRTTRPVEGSSDSTLEKLDGNQYRIVLPRAEQHEYESRHFVVNLGR